MDKLIEILEEVYWKDRPKDWAVHTKNHAQYIAEMLSAIHSELKGLVEDKKITDENIATIKDSNMQIAMKVAQELQRRVGFNTANALWRTKLAEKFEVNPPTKEE